MKRCTIEQHGGPEVLTWTESDSPAPKAGEVLLKNIAIGVNFIDTYHRFGLYPLELPSGLGIEAVSEVVDCGEGVKDLNVGDRVVNGGSPMGFYAEQTMATAKNCILVPDGFCSQKLAGSWLKGLTAAYLLHDTYNVQPGDLVLIHAAAGGVGQILCQWAKLLGAEVIGTVGSSAKAELAIACGCDHIVLYESEDLVQRVKDISKGQGVAVVYDSVGAKTFETSLQCCRTRGMVVSFGNASGPVPPLSPLTLTQHGSLYLTRPTLAHHFESPQDREILSELLFDVLPQIEIQVKTYPLEQAAQAHMDLESRSTTGSLVLVP